MQLYQNVNLKPKAGQDTYMLSNISEAQSIMNRCLISGGLPHYSVVAQYSASFSSISRPKLGLAWLGLWRVGEELTRRFPDYNYLISGLGKRLFFWKL